MSEDWGHRHITLRIERGQGIEVSLKIDPWLLFGPAIAVVLIVVTAGLAVAIGAGVVGWSYWWLLPSGIPATLAVLSWIKLFFTLAP